MPQLSGCAVPLLLLRQQVREIPVSLTEAATLLDGANSWQALWHVVLPVLRPALTAVAILVFASTWNEYLWPLIATPGGSPGTIQTSLTLFLNTEGASPGPLLAAATLATLPVLAAYACAARQITNAFHALRHRVTGYHPVTGQFRPRRGPPGGGERGCHEKRTSQPEPGPCILHRMYSPRIVARVNDYDVRIAHARGEHVWHVHEHTDEFFLVLDGEAGRVAARGRPGAGRRLGAGEIFVVPRGTEHKPSSPGGAILMFEPSGT